jgi:predicted DNA-binding ribbon-helix-helix protein
LTRKVEVLLETDTHEQLRALAARRSVSVAALIREALEEKLSSPRPSR